MKIKQTHRIYPPVAAGFTLVEILVVLVIATVVLSIAIPRIRSINEERNYREAARVVGSAFANASQRAVLDGVAGVRISRNANFEVAGTTQHFAATEISLLRAVPNYTGDEAWFEGRTNFFGADDPLGAEKTSDTVVQIPVPIEHSPTEGRLVVQEGDEISFNYSNTRFRISTQPMVSGDNLVLTLDVVADGYPKLPETMDDVPYVIYRQPRLLRSSTTSLPENYIIDLRYSGFLVQDAGTFVPPSGPVRPVQLTTVFEPSPVDFGVTPPTENQENYTIDYIFDEEGTVDRVIYRDLDGNVVDRQPLGSSYFLIAQAPSDFDGSGEVAIANDLSLWVTINRNGATNIGYNVTFDAIGTSLAGTTLTQLSQYYFNVEDPDFDLENDRDEFNSILATCRGIAVSGSATQ